MPNSVVRLREPVPAALRRAVLVVSPDCSYCGQPSVSAVDHVLPVISGGRSVLTNLVSACDLCNSQKRGRTAEQWRTWRSERGYCWPPRSRWTAGTFADVAMDGSRPMTLLELTRPEWTSELLTARKAWARRRHNGVTGPASEEIERIVAAVEADVEALLGYLPDQGDAGTAHLVRAWRSCHGIGAA